MIGIPNNAEVIGGSVQIIIQAMGNVKEMGLRVLKENGVDTNVPPDGWVNLEKWINSLKAIEKSFGPNTLFMIGKKVPEIIPFPKLDFASAMNGININYLNSHKNIDKAASYYKFTKKGEKSAIVVCTNPYPSDFDRGLIAGLSRKFAPANTTSLVEVELDTTLPSRKSGAVSCTFNLIWK